LEQLLRAPGVLETDEEFADAEEFWPAVKTALEKALAMLLKMRTREGAHLAKDDGADWSSQFLRRWVMDEQVWSLDAGGAHRHHSHTSK